MAKRVACPHCGNSDRNAIQDNGVKPASFDYTLLCVARVEPKDRAHTHVDLDPDQIGADGKTECGMSWCPNDG